MKVFNACFLGDISWFSARKTQGRYPTVMHALKAHLRYITKSSHAILAYGLADKGWEDLVNEELEKRWDARVAGKFFLTLPNDLGPEEALQIVRSFLEEKIGAQAYTVAIHCNVGLISGEDNLHAHIVFYPRDRKGKRISFDRERLRQLHKDWRRHLLKYGYLVPDMPDDLKGEHIFINRRSPDPEVIQRLKEQTEARRQYLNGLWPQGQTTGTSTQQTEEETTTSEQQTIEETTAKNEQPRRFKIRLKLEPPENSGGAGSVPTKGPVIVSWTIRRFDDTKSGTRPPPAPEI